ncbi:hypothetical protein [Terrimonas ferruginea]|uniref:hypothetical protein n=1 Tax=Terrimonas ferruginea TaxID=249 RepID=UPI00048DBB60|nr:hypothetical protein [Terrimonas ferruginea]
MTKLFVVFFCCFLQASPSTAQADLHRYIRLHIQYYQEDGERYLGVSPELVTSGTDLLSAAMKKYPRRFRYVLLNKTRFQGIYEKYYPDTIRINRLFTDTLAHDSSFMRVFTQLSQPFIKKENRPVSFTREQMMKVAARFFYCQSVRNDTTISTTICIGRNGLTNLDTGEDQALLEAFCFEAIFEKYYQSPGVRNQFIKNFLTYVEEGQARYSYLLNDRELYLVSVRNYCFEKMENDRELEEALMNYYEESREGWGMLIA